MCAVIEHSTLAAVDKQTQRHRPLWEAVVALPHGHAWLLAALLPVQPRKSASETAVAPEMVSGCTGCRNDQMPW